MYRIRRLTVVVFNYDKKRTELYVYNFDQFYRHLFVKKKKKIRYFQKQYK